MAEKDGPPKYEDADDHPTTPVPAPTKSVVVTIIHRKPGTIINNRSQMTISTKPTDILRQRNDAISIPTTITRWELTLLLWERAQVHFGREVVPDFDAIKNDLGTKGFFMLAVKYSGKRIGIVDDAAWAAAKGWVFEGAAELDFDVVVTPVVMQEDGSVETVGKKKKGCVVQ